MMHQYYKHRHDVNFKNNHMDVKYAITHATRQHSKLCHSSTSIILCMSEQHTQASASD